MKDGFFIVASLPHAEAQTSHAVEIVVLPRWGGVVGARGRGGGLFLLSADHPLPRQFKKIKVELCSILSRQRMHLANLPVHVNGIK